MNISQASFWLSVLLAIKWLVWLITPLGLWPFLCTAIFILTLRAHSVPPAILSTIALLQKSGPAFRIPGGYYGVCFVYFPPRSSLGAAFGAPLVAAGWHQACGAYRMGHMNEEEVPWVIRNGWFALCVQSCSMTMYTLFCHQERVRKKKKEGVRRPILPHGAFAKYLGWFTCLCFTDCVYLCIFRVGS